MTLDEALELVEIALDYQRLNKVQDLVFRQSWAGRSYKEIAGSSEYEYDYIKAAGAELWKLLSKALGEKVKKDNLQSVLKRHRKRNQANVHRTQVIGVNFSGASLNESSLSGANLTVTKLLGSIYEGDFCQGDLYKTVIPDVQTELREENISSEQRHNQAIQKDSEEQIYHWNDLRFRSDAQIKIAEALDRANVLFFHNSKARITTTEGRENQEPNFLIFHNGKWGILEVDGEVDEKRDLHFQSHGIPIIQHYDSIQCSEQPDLVVQQFLEMLTQV